MSVKIIMIIVVSGVEKRNVGRVSFSKRGAQRGKLKLGKGSKLSGPIFNLPRWRILVLCLKTTCRLAITTLFLWLSLNTIILKTHHVPIELRVVSFTIQAIIHLGGARVSRSFY